MGSELELRKVWKAGSEKGYSYCISIPISYARKYNITNGSTVVFFDNYNGLFLRKLVIE